jgi:CheY-like chemotaxis protein
MSEQGPAKQVLIVDDDAIMGELLDALLTLEGYRVTRAISGEEALEVVKHGQPTPEIILCDLQMPGIHGGELASALLAGRIAGILSASAVLLGMSGSSPTTEESAAFDGFLRKPFSVEDFIHAVDHARSRSESPAAQEEQPPAVSDEQNRSAPLSKTIFEQLRAKIGPESLRQLYDMTLEDVRARLERIAAAADRHDSATIRQEAHTIKGSCGMVGALELQALAAATEGGSPVDTSTLALFNSACKRLERMLNEKLLERP